MLRVLSTGTRGHNVAAITVSDADVACAATSVTTVAASKATRVGGSLQNQSRTTTLRVRLGSDPTAVLGFILPPLESVNFGALVTVQGNTVDNLQEDVRVFNPSAKSINCYVIQGEVP